MPLDLTPNKPPYYEIVEESGAAGTHTSLLNQTAANEPVETILNPANPGTWTGPHQVGVYNYTLTTPVNKNKLFIPGFNQWGGPNTQIQPLFNGSAISGYVIMYTSVTGDNVTAIHIETYDQTFTLVEMGTLVQNLNFEFRVYP